MSANEAFAPLSSQQELWCMNEAAFGPGFVVAMALRVTGQVDVAALHGALDDVVERHEVLRTTLVRDTRPPHQRIHPPLPVPLVVRDLPASDRRSRDEAAADLLAEVKRSSLPVEELPLLRAYLSRFDHQDSVLGLVVHHIASDGWSCDLIMRDLATRYAARTGAATPELPPAHQYADYARWQRDNLTGPAAAANLAYWREHLTGAEIFSLPTDRPARQVRETPYLACRTLIDANLAANVARLAKTMRTSRFVVLLAALNVLAHRIRSTFDPVINTIVHGRGNPRFRATVGPFLNFLALRTDLTDCVTFRDVLLHTRDTCQWAYKHEAPIERVKQEIPTLMASVAHPHNCDFIFGYQEPPISRGTADEKNPFQIAERSTVVRQRGRTSEEMPGGAAWNLTLVPSGEISGAVRFNPEEFDESTVAGWVSDYCRIVAEAVADPDREWKAL